MMSPRKLLAGRGSVQSTAEWWRLRSRKGSQGPRKLHRISKKEIISFWMIEGLLRFAAAGLEGTGAGGRDTQLPHLSKPEGVRAWFSRNPKPGSLAVTGAEAKGQAPLWASTSSPPQVAGLPSVPCVYQLSGSGGKSG